MSFGGGLVFGLVLLSWGAVSQAVPGNCKTYTWERSPNVQRSGIHERDYPINSTTQDFSEIGWSKSGATRRTKYISTKEQYDQLFLPLPDERVLNKILPKDLPQLGAGETRRPFSTPSPTMANCNNNGTRGALSSAEPVRYQNYQNPRPSECYASEYYKSDSYMRPLGYKYAVIGSYNNPMPCVEVTGVNSFGIEILVYALEDVQICIKDLDSSSFTNQVAGVMDACGQQKVMKCFIAPSVPPSGITGSATFRFGIYIPGEPIDNSVPVLYRLRHSQVPYTDPSRYKTTDNTEMWCMMIANGRAAQWPDFSSDTPNGYTQRTSRASLTSPSGIIGCMVALFAAVFAALC